ncbi:MAG: hypothetical protein ABJC13_16120 [Acidobacteriota bacterium]
MQKKPKKLSLHTETLRHLAQDAVAKADGAYPPSAPRTCACNESGVSQCVCSLDVSVCW